MSPLVEGLELTKEYQVGRGLVTKGRVLRAVRGVTVGIEEGTAVGLVGESGSGKSTLGQLLLGLERPTHGEVRFGGRSLSSLRPEEMRRLRKEIQIVFQDPYGSLNPRMTVGASIREGLDVHRPDLSREERDQRVRSLLERVGLDPEQGARFPGEFSGGQRQRIAIARALAIEPRFLVADEPVSALDVCVQAQVVRLLDELQRERRLTLLFISHDLKVIRHLSSRTIVMYAGRIVEDAPTAALFERPLHPYTTALLSAIPEARPDHRRPRIALAGEPPSPLMAEPGCAFHPRCPHYGGLDEAEKARCRTRLPMLGEVEGPVRRVACHFVQ